MAGIAQVWGYKFGCVLISVVSPYSNGAVPIRVGLELAAHFEKSPPTGAREALSVRNAQMSIKSFCP